MVGSISHHSVQQLVCLQGAVAPSAANSSIVAAMSPIEAPIDRPEHKASMAALAPAAMSALIQAQESMGRDASPAARSDTARKIDQLLTQLDGGAAPSLPPAQPSFPVQMLLAARQQLSHA